MTADAAVAAAEVTRGKPESSVCALEAADTSQVGPGVTVDSPLSDPQRGTRWLRLEDPDRRTHSLEEAP